jgi:hypothetical protein
MPCLTRCPRSRRAVSCEDFVSFAYLVVVSVPSKLVKEPVKHKSLMIVNGNPLHALPGPSLGEDSAEHSLRTIDGAAKASQEPLHPRRNIHVRFLRLFKNVVIGRALLADLRRHAVEALGAVF